MIAFCRRLDESERVLAEMAKNGLKRAERTSGLYQCAKFNNVILVDESASY